MDGASVNSKPDTTTLRNRDDSNRENAIIVFIRYEPSSNLWRSNRLQDFDYAICCMKYTVEFWIIATYNQL